jgi:hypothetical protein
MSTYQKKRLGLAAILGISSLFLSFHSFATIKLRDKADVILPSLISKEPNNFLLYVGTSCFGEWHGTLSKDDSGSQYLATGNINVLLKNREHRRLDVSLKLAFNELDQLGGSIIKITDKNNPTEQITIGTSKIDPMELEVHVLKNGQVSSFRGQLPGPTMLSPSGKTTFGLLSPITALTAPFSSALSAFSATPTDNLQSCPQSTPLDFSFQDDAMVTFNSLFEQLTTQK